ncbi:MAG: outer membrane protein assembly factor BamA [Gammaproteobacteria bacterium]|nr:outer membrane protein assembly factor BamA [Gammaproteobacteria bacterium]
MKRKLGALVFSCAILSNAWAIETFQIKDIRVEGLQRISAGTVFNYLPIKVGERIDDARSTNVIRALFKTGFFKDVRLERDGDVLIVFVHESPAINSIDLKGNLEIDKDSLLESLKEVGFVEGRVFDRSILERVEAELERQYFSQGKYGVKIDSTVTPLERNRVDIEISIVEGEPARIHQINIIGNNVFNDETLLDEMESNTTNWISFFTKDDQYSKQKLGADLETIRSYYLDRGYINFDITSTQVSITPDKQDIYVTINLNEGEKFTVSDIKLAGDLVIPEAEIKPLISTAKNEIFSRVKVTESTKSITDRLGNEGYAFANVNAVPDINEENKTVALTYFVDPGKRVYVHRINMEGNTRTADEVIRREMRQMEGAWVSTEQVERSKARLERTDYFEEVSVETPPVPGTTDQVDVNFKVTEKASGNLTAGLGFSQAQGLVFNASVSQDNFLGTGRRLSFAFNNSDVNTVYSFGYMNPYYTIDGVSRGFNFFSRETDAGQANVGNFLSNTYGGDMSFGIPINEYDSIYASVGVENIEITTGSTTPTEYLNFINQNGSDYSNATVKGSWAHDTRNRSVFATRGVLQRLNAEMTLGDLTYFKVNYKHRKYFPLTKTLTLALNGEVAYGEGFGGTTDLPFYENYYAGGPGSVRGYQANTLGPRASNTEPLGGNIKILGNMEVIFPVPFIKKSPKSLRLTAFLDAGNVYGFGQDFDIGQLRYSTGVSATWLSPFGALTFSLAETLNDEAGDETEFFQFQLGTSFR